MSDAFSKLMKTTEGQKQNAVQNENKAAQEAQAATEKEVVPTQEVKQPEITAEMWDDYAKKNGWKKDEVTETPEQKAERLQREENELATFGINNLGMKPEDFAMRKMIESKTDEELDFEEYRSGLLKINPKLSESKIRTRYMKENHLEEYPPFTMDEVEDNYEEELKKYNEAKKEYEADKADSLARIKINSEHIKSRYNSPIENARRNFEQYKNNEKIVLKVSNEVDTFAKSFGKSFVYQTEDGSFNIDLPTDDNFKTEFIDNLRREAVNRQFQNPSGSVDIGKLANEMLTVGLRKNIDGVLKSKYYNDGIAEGKRGFKNPITHPTYSGDNVDIEKLKEGEKVNKNSSQQLKSLVR